MGDFSVGRAVAGAQEMDGCLELGGNNGHGGMDRLRDINDAEW